VIKIALKFLKACLNSHENDRTKDEISQAHITINDNSVDNNNTGSISNYNRGSSHNITNIEGRREKTL
jgi:hypothetical protein